MDTVVGQSEACSEWGNKKKKREEGGDGVQRGEAQR